MYLVDTSVWIDLFGTRPKLSVPVRHMPHLGTCPPVIQEVLQGISSSTAFASVKHGFLAMSCYPENLSLETYLEAADVFRSGRRRGMTIRSSVDCLIAAIAIQHELIVWHIDRDFDQIAKFTNLKTCRVLPP